MKETKIPLFESMGFHFDLLICPTLLSVEPLNHQNWQQDGLHSHYLWLHQISIVESLLIQSCLLRSLSTFYTLSKNWILSFPL